MESDLVTPPQISYLALPLCLWSQEIISHIPKQRDILNLRSVNKLFRCLVRDSSQWSLVSFFIDSQKNFSQWTEEFPLIEPSILWFDIPHFVSLTNEIEMGSFTLESYESVTDIIIGYKNTAMDDAMELDLIQRFCGCLHEFKSISPPKLKRIVIRLRCHARGNPEVRIGNLLYGLFKDFQDLLPNIDLWIDVPKDLTPKLINRPYRYGEKTQTRPREFIMRTPENEAHVENLLQKLSDSGQEYVADLDTPLFHLSQDTPAIATSWLSPFAVGILYCCVWGETLRLGIDCDIDIYDECLIILNDAQQKKHIQAMEELRISGPKLLHYLLIRLFRSTADIFPSEKKNNSRFALIQWLIHNIGTKVDMDFDSIIRKQNGHNASLNEIKLRIPIRNSPSLLHLLACVVPEVEHIDPATIKHFSDICSLLVSEGAHPRVEDQTWSMIGPFMPAKIFMQLKYMRKKCYG